MAIVHLSVNLKVGDKVFMKGQYGPENIPEPILAEVEAKSRYVMVVDDKPAKEPAKEPDKEPAKKPAAKKPAPKK